MIARSMSSSCIPTATQVLLCHHTVTVDHTEILSDGVNSTNSQQKPDFAVRDKADLPLGQQASGQVA
jgi:hypothetical protein